MRILGSLSDITCTQRLLYLNHARNLGEHHWLRRDEDSGQVRLLQEVNILTQTFRADHEHICSPATCLFAGDRSTRGDYVYAVRSEMCGVLLRNPCAQSN